MASNGEDDKLFDLGAQREKLLEPPSELRFDGKSDGPYQYSIQSFRQAISSLNLLGRIRAANEATRRRFSRTTRHVGGGFTRLRHPKHPANDTDDSFWGRPTGNFQARFASPGDRRLDFGGLLDDTAKNRMLTHPPGGGKGHVQELENISLASIPESHLAPPPLSHWQQIWSSLFGWFRATKFFISKCIGSAFNLIALAVSPFWDLYVLLCLKFCLYWRSVVSTILLFGLFALFLTCTPDLSYLNDFIKSAAGLVDLPTPPPWENGKCGWENTQETPSPNACSQTDSLRADSLRAHFANRIEALEQGLAQKSTLDEGYVARMDKVEKTLSDLLKNKKSAQNQEEISKLVKELGHMKSQNMMDREAFRNLEERVDAKQKEHAEEMAKREKKLQELVQEQQAFRGQLEEVKQSLETLTEKVNDAGSSSKGHKSEIPRSNATLTKLKADLDALRESYKGANAKWVTAEQLDARMKKAGLRSSSLSKIDPSLKEEVGGLQAEVARVAEQLAKMEKDRTGVVDCIDKVGDHSKAYRETWDFARQLFFVDVPYSPAQETLEPVFRQGDCWAMSGMEGWIIYDLIQTTIVDRVSIEHIHQEITHNEKSTPRDFTVFGRRRVQPGISSSVKGFFFLDGREYGNWDELGTFTYMRLGDTIQYFPVQKQPIGLQAKYDQVKFEVNSNYGHHDFTCIYRIRVHGDCIKKAMI